MSGPRPPESVVVEADGGSRGNPGPAAYGAVLLDDGTHEAIAERAEGIGVATDNVAAYHGLVAGLELHLAHTPGADLEVRLDSRLVVEQMSGRWRVGHPDLRPLAARARQLAPTGTTYTWVPRTRDTRSGRLLDAVLDAGSGSATAVAATGTATTLVLVRHGVTEHTVGGRFSSGLGGSDPGLTEEGRAQVRATADWLSPMADAVEQVVTAPARRTRETAEILGGRLDRPVVCEEGLAEMEFGAWEGLTFAEVRRRHPDDVDRWLGSLDASAGGGESFRVLQQRVLTSLTRVLARHAGRTVVTVSHATPIKVLAAHALGAPLESVHRMELAPASVSVVAFYADGNASMRLFNARPEDAALTGR